MLVMSRNRYYLIFRESIQDSSNWGSIKEGRGTTQYVLQDNVVIVLGSFHRSICKKNALEQCCNTSQPNKTSINFQIKSVFSGIFASWWFRSILNVIWPVRQPSDQSQGKWRIVQMMQYTNPLLPRVVVVSSPKAIAVAKQTKNPPYAFM